MGDFSENEARSVRSCNPSDPPEVHSLVEGCTRRQVALVSHPDEVHHADELAVVGLRDTEHFNRTGHDLLLQNLNLALLVQGHVPDCEAALCIADCHVDLLVLSRTDRFDTAHGNL